MTKYYNEYIEVDGSIVHLLKNTPGPIPPEEMELILADIREFDEECQREMEAGGELSERGKQGSGTTPDR